MSYLTTGRIFIYQGKSRFFVIARRVKDPTKQSIFQMNLWIATAHKGPRNDAEKNMSGVEMANSKVRFFIFYRYSKNGLRSQDRKVRAESSNEAGSKEHRNQSEDLN